MATAEQIAAFRLLISEPENVEPYTDVYIGNLLDAAASDGTSTSSVAYLVWTQKAASWTSMVDTSEGGSSRKMSDLIDNALKMAAIFRDQATSGTIPPGLSSGTRVSRLTRL